MSESRPNKNLGQHWMHDHRVLQHMAKSADVQSEDTVLEIGPGLGTLTRVLASHAKQVIAVEFDPELAAQLSTRVKVDNLEVVSGDILKYNLLQLPAGYKVVANVPYYITSKIVQLLLTSHNRPSRIALLVQKEVAERLAAKPGDMSILAVSAQLYADVSLGEVVPAALFTPPPKVDSQVVILKTRQQPLFDVPYEDIFKVVKAGFSAKRKKLRSSLAGGLEIGKPEAEALLVKAGIDPNARAETLALEQWAQLARIVA